MTVKEFGLTLQFDYRTVYWNSRLSAERMRVPHGQLLSLTAGLGQGGAPSDGGLEI